MSATDLATVSLHPTFGQLRTWQEDDGTVTFCGRDAATALGYRDGKNALKQHCRDGVVKHHPIVDALGRTQNARFITEGDLYRLIVNSKLPAARRFEKWVFDEMLPTIRKTGTYSATGQSGPALSEDEIVHQALQITVRRVEQLETQLAKAQPKLDAYDQFLNGSGCYLVDTAANLLGIGHRKLWTWLYESKLLIPSGPRKRQPYANPKTKTWFEVKTYSTDKTNGKARSTTYITPVGLEAIRLRLLREGLIEATLFALPNPRREALA